MPLTETPHDRPVPPGPEDPVDINVDEASFHAMQAMFHEFGGIYAVRPPGRDNMLYVVSDPDLIQRVLVTNHRNYVKGRGFERVRMLLGNGLIVSEGEHWRRQRRMLQPAFQRPNVEALSEVMRQCTDRFLERWKEKARAGETVDVSADTSALALEVILRAILGDDLDRLIEARRGNPFLLLVEQRERDLQLVIRFRALIPPIREIVEDRRRRDVHRLDFLSLFMDARDKETGEPMTDKDLLDEIMTLIVAGHETTALNLNWIWYLLAENPQAEARVHAEVDALDVDGPPRIEDLPRLTYTRQVMDEALRLYPPVWMFTRKAVGEDRLGDYHVPAGTDIALSPYIAHRHPQHWDDPEVFRPERFAPEAVRARHRYAYFPFSMGARRCTGEYFSTVEAQIHVGHIARHLQLRRADNRPVELEPAVNLRNKQGIMMIPELR